MSATVPSRSGSGAVRRDGRHGCVLQHHWCKSSASTVRTRANGIQRHRSGDASPHSICVLAYLHKQRTVIHRCGNAGNLKMFYCERYVILSDGAGQDYSRVWREMHWYKNCAGIFRIWERKTSDAITLTFSTNLLRRDRVHWQIITPNVQSIRMSTRSDPSMAVSDDAGK